MIKFLHNEKIPVKEYLLADLDGFIRDDSKVLEELVKDRLLTKREILDSFDEDTFISRANYHYLKKYLNFKKLSKTSTYFFIIGDCKLSYLNDLKKDGLRLEELTNDQEQQVYEGIYDLLEHGSNDLNCMENLLNKLISMGLSRKIIENVSLNQEEKDEPIRVKIIGNSKKFYVQIIEVEVPITDVYQNYANTPGGALQPIMIDDDEDDEWDNENDEGEVAILEDDDDDE